MRCLAAWIALLFGAPVAAHKPSDAYLSAAVHDDRVAVRWDVALRDLDQQLGLDVDDDGRLTWGEIRARHRDIEAFLSPQLRISTPEGACDIPPGGATTHRLDRHSDGTYEVMEYELRCPRMVRSIEIEYRLFAATDPTHRGIVRVVGADGATSATAVLGPDQPHRRFELSSPSRLETLREFVGEGITHIWLGFDHILFLLSLLLPSVLVRSGQGASSAWRGAPSARTACVEVLKVVTAFTAAHSITLSMAVLDVVTLPSRLVESGIALTVILASLNNLRPLVRERRWVVAFAFGLIHGFGFAAALKDLGLPPQALALSLLGFNLGVELGQLALVALFFPVAFLLRDSRVYRRFVLGAGSVAVATLAALWLYERAFDVQLPWLPA